VGWTFYNSSGQRLSSKGKVPVSDLADGTDGELITWGTDAAPTTVAAGTSGYVLTSGGANAVPSFQAAASVSSRVVNTIVRAAAAGSGDVSYTGAGFAPSAIILLAFNEDDVNGISIGVGDSAAREGDIEFYLGGTDGQEAARIAQVGGGSNGQHASLKTMDADGVTLTWTKYGAGRQAHFTILYLK